MNEKKENRVNVIFLFRDGRGEDYIAPKIDIFKTCYDDHYFSVSEINEVRLDESEPMCFKNHQGDRVRFMTAFAPHVNGLSSRGLNYLDPRYYERILESFGIMPDEDLMTKTVFVNCLARDNGDAKVYLDEAIDHYSRYLEPCTVITDVMELVDDPSVAYHYERLAIEAKIRIRYGQSRKECGFSHAAEQLLTRGFGDGKIDKDDRTEMIKLGLIFEAASALLKI